jgi:Arginase family
MGHFRRGRLAALIDSAPRTFFGVPSLRDLELLDAQVPGGLGYRDLRAILVEVARRGRVIGFDVVELNPARDPSGATARVATWIVTHSSARSLISRAE